MAKLDTKKLDTGTWVVIADGEKALFLENITDAKDPNLTVRHVAMQENPPDRAQGTDRPGRMADNGPGQKSAFDETDWHQLAKDRFAEDLAEQLYKLAHRGAYKRLVIAASPKVLGVLRPALHKEVTDKLVAEIPKTYTNAPRDQIERWLCADLAA
ncbi:host attachment family protein [Thioclava sp. GXIMD4216]|uniref:Host attachment family protein n=1 Tax=Thioclava litoralis TaxID=3076557 RepID=A0ABZ1DWJ0_9RHOB|nr:host attachment family protein [Thioclava sp. FTW29]